MHNDLQSSQANQNPVAVFRQVYRNSDAGLQGAAVASGRGESKSGHVTGFSDTAHLRGKLLNHQHHPCFMNFKATEP
jgi:hypothetical protein